MRYVTKEVTPAMAQKLLDNRAPNRGVSDAYVNQLSADMKTGAWRVTGVPVVVNDKEQLIDGQHRLAAVVASGCTISMTICYGVSDPHAQRNIDTGRKRPIAQVLQMFEGVKNATRAVAVMRNIVMLRADSSAAGAGFSVDAAVAFLASSPGTQWVLSSTAATMKSRKAATPILAAFAIAYEVDPNKTLEAFHAFFEQEFTSGDPMRALSKWLDNPLSATTGADSRLALGRRALTALAYRFRGEPLLKSQDSIDGMKHFKVSETPRSRRGRNIH